ARGSPSNSHWRVTDKARWSGSIMRRRWSTLKLASFFFKPLQLHLQPPDLLEQLLLAGLRRCCVGVRFAGEDFGQSLGCFPFPLAHLHRMHSVLRGDGV